MVASYAAREAAASAANSAVVLLTVEYPTTTVDDGSEEFMLHEFIDDVDAPPFVEKKEDTSKA